MKNGDICWVNLDPTVGDEIRKRRPVVIINEGHEKHLKLAIVVPVTEWASRFAQNPFFVTLESGARTGLRKRSVIDCFQIRSVSHRRLAGKIGEVTAQEMSSIKKSLALILDIDPEDCD